MKADSMRYLAQAYFHQDYDLEAEEPIQILTEFRQVEPPEVVEELRASLEQILASGMGEGGLAEVWLETAGASYDPRQDGIAMSLWFHQVIDALT
ncbi:contact-dependent growth inhibition system immunity protein [Streptomyces sp. NPDC052114]|uniref:contact-dependent growth inhibition system immunity protein n=1 Tax=unclassified Streptomyces TaxID=2593676 RepID=UPI00343BDAD9